MRILLFVFFQVFISSHAFAQNFKIIPKNYISGAKPLEFRETLITTKGTVLVTSTLPSLAEIDKMQIQIDPPANNGLKDGKGNRVKFGKQSTIFKDLFYNFSGIKLIAEGPGKIIYIVSDSNNFGLINYNFSKGNIAPSPFMFPKNSGIDIKKIWFDVKGNLFIGTNTDTLYVIEDAANVVKDNTDKSKPGINFTTGLDKDSNIIVTKGAKLIKKFFLGKNVLPFSFMHDPDKDNIVWIGTNNGLLKFETQTGAFVYIIEPVKSNGITITHVSAEKTSGTIWFSTLEKGMGRYNTLNNSVRYYPYKTIPPINPLTKNPIQIFCRKSANEFFVAPVDSLPAVFNTETGIYTFISDKSFLETKNRTTDVKLDSYGNLYIIKGGGFYRAQGLLKDPLFAEVKPDSSIPLVVITEVQVNNIPYSQLKNTYVNYEVTKKIDLKYNENNLTIFFSGRSFSSDDTLTFAWKLDGYSDEWNNVPYSFLDEKFNIVDLQNIPPGKYLFHAKVKKGNGEWKKAEALLTIVITKPLWQNLWFLLLVLVCTVSLIFLIVRLRENAVRKQEREKLKYEKQLIEMEARALRAQMNPHFIFNCLNSIKALIQTDEKQKAAEYLTTFSKLIRTLFQNSDKRQISLYDEIETCKLYTQLEIMRFSGKLKCSFQIDQNLDLKSVKVPALILQPFIENAIWHGIAPKEEGGTISVILKQNDDHIICEIDDDGIGRKLSALNKPADTVTHISKGVHLSQARLNLEKTLNETNASIETFDKYEQNLAIGTRVILTFNFIN